MKTYIKNNSNKNVLPNNYLIEQSVLNIFLTSGDSRTTNLIKNIIPTLKLEAFYYESHRLIYQTILELAETNQIVNITTVLSKLQATGNIQKIGGIKGITMIINHIELTSSLEEYVESLNETYIRRLIIELGKNCIAWGFNDLYPVNEILIKLEQSFLQFNELKIIEKIESAAEIIEEIYEDMKKKKSLDSAFKTSYTDFDALVQGFQKSDLIIIAGRPSMGKTAFSLNLAKNIVEKYHIPLIIFTLEMSRQQIIYRFLSSEAKIRNNRIKSASLTTNEINKVTESMKNISKLPIYVDDSSNLNIADIRLKLQKILTKKNQPGLVIIDYLQLMKPNIKLENRVQEISYLTRNLKLLAKEFNIPIILLSQLSRSVESRVNKRPMLSDLRESGCFTDLNKKIAKSWNLEKIINNNTNLKIEFKGIKPTYLLTFENNIKIQLTATHKILCQNGWKKISEMNTTTKIYFLSKTNIKKYKYLKIKKIAYQGIYAVYDKTIPLFHNYIVDNLILHNSIEQDADVVIMLYREDYYKNNLLNGKQLTEFIIAKHRNGPVGTAELMFDPEITTFTNKLKNI